MPYYEVGDTKPLAADIVDANGDPANALTATLTITKGDGTIATPTVTNPPAVTGHYVNDCPLTVAGLHSAAWLFTFTGGLTTAHSENWNVNPTASGALISLADAKEHLNITSTDHDEELRGWLGSATEVIRRHTGKEIARTTYTDRLSASGDELWLHHRPVLSLTSITSLDGSVTWPVLATNVDVDGDWGRLTRLSGSSWYGRLKVTYVAGMSVVPDNYTRAARILVEELWNTQRQPGVGPSPTPFDRQRFAPKPAQVDIPPLAKALLGPPGVMVA